MADKLNNYIEECTKDFTNRNLNNYNRIALEDKMKNILKK